MTTVLLAQKLKTINLDRNQIESIKWQRLHNMQKTHKVVNSLKHILDNQILNQTCRLCLKSGGRGIFNQDLDIASNIKYILGIEIREGDGKPQHICKSCEDTVQLAVQLKQTAETSQWRLQQELDMVAELTSDWVNEDLCNNKPSGGYFRSNVDDITREWACGKCKRIFHSCEEYSEHTKLPTCRTAVRYYVCESCGLELKSLSRLKRHRLIHSPWLQFGCPRCPYRARTKYALAVHQRGHSGARPLRCPHCPDTFANSSNLASHRRKHLPPRYHCDACHKGFKFKQTLHNHMATQHSNVKPFSCCTCGKAFSTRKMVLRHELKVHNRPKMRSGITPSYIKQQEEELNT